jgi:RHS repeat-associated protein
MGFGGVDRRLASGGSHGWSCPPGARACRSDTRHGRGSRARGTLNYSVTALVDGSDGGVVERYVYDPYGKVSFYDGSWTGRGSSAYHNAILYCGYTYDRRTGLYHVRRRMYHPTLGRWAQRDAVGYADGISVYEYARSSPIVRREAVQKLQQQSAQLRRAGIPERPPTDPAARVGGNRPVPPSPGGGRFPREREPADELSL